MKTFVFTMIVLCSVLDARAQTVIEGIVADSLEQAIEAYITVSPQGSSSIIGFCETDSKGHYSVSVETDADSLVIVAAGLSIGRHMRVVANRSHRVDMIVSNDGISLKEVSVRAEKIRQDGDTLTYNVAAFQQQGDRVIGDVLKRMPGIEVADNGAIKYNGKAIRKFYVEEMDLLQGRYGIATNNINANDVASVQVLENHQPVKALQGKEPTDDVAINLKLKDSAKGTIAINTMLGGGVQQSGEWKLNRGALSDMKTIGHNPLWAAEIVGMYFAKTRQNMTLYKGNNTGDDVSKELTQHYYSINAVPLYPFCPTNALMPSGSGLPQKRTFDNRSNILTMNHLEKVGKDTELGLNIAYHNDQIRSEGMTNNDIFISDDNRLNTTETMTSETTLNNLNVQARYYWNATEGFVANILTMDGGWNTDDVVGELTSGITGTNPANYGTNRVTQHFRRPKLSVSNTFNTIRSIGERTFDLHFSAGYAHRPNTLSVGIDSLMQGTSTAYSQDVSSHHIAARFNTSYGIRVSDHFRFSYGFNTSANMHGIVTDLDGFVPPADNPQLNNDLWYNTYNISLGQSYKYESHDMTITLGLPLELYTQTLDDRIRNDKHSYTHLLFFPSLSATYDVTRDLWATASVNYSKTVGDPGGIYSGYIMSNYRAFQRSYVEQLSETKNYGASASLRYRSAIRALFANIGFNYNRTNDNQVYGYSYEGATSVVQAIDQPTVADRYSLNGEASKGFDFMRSSVRIFGSYGLSRSERLIDDNLYQYSSKALSLGGSVSFSPIDWIGIVYSSGWSQSHSYTANQRDASMRVCNSTQRLSMSLYPTQTLTLTLAAEDNYNNLTATNRHAWFGDASAKLKMKRIDLEFQFNNIFDIRQYTRVSYNGLDIYTQTSQLRSRNVLATVRFKLL